MTHDDRKAALMALVRATPSPTRALSTMPRNASDEPRIATSNPAMEPPATKPVEKSMPEETSDSASASALLMHSSRVAPST